jgi:hypothetical protein
MRVEFQLKVEPAPTLVDFGAADTVYGVLRDREQMILEAGDAPGLAGLGRPWVVRKGPDGNLAPFALASRPDAVGRGGPRHGRVPLHGFGRRPVRPGVAGSDRDRDRRPGPDLPRVRGCRRGATAGPKALTCWFHFVQMPVQVGAATSPQAILAPLEVEFARDATRP